MATPNMSLPIATVGVTDGPEWASLINSCFTIIDGHTHTVGSGVLITSAALNINADLPIGSNNLTGIRSTRFSPQSAALALAGDVRCVYAINGDLYYNNAAGTAVQITNGGSIVGTAGSITGLPSGTASAVYTAISGTFVWQSATAIAANMDFGSAILRNTSPNSIYGLTLSPPASLAANYALTLPPLPASQKFMTLSSSGVMTAPWAVDGATLEIASSTTLQVKDSGIVTAKIADLNVTNVKIANTSITINKQAAKVVTTNGTDPGVGGLSQSVFIASSSGTGTILETILTTTGRPVRMWLRGDPSGSSPGITMLPDTVLPMTWRTDGTVVERGSFQSGVGGNMKVSPSACSGMDVNCAAGTHTFAFACTVTPGDILFTEIALCAQEIY